MLPSKLLVFESISDSSDRLLRRSLRPLFLSVWPYNQREVNRLREMREALTNEISEVIGTFNLLVLVIPISKLTSIFRRIRSKTIR